MFMYKLHRIHLGLGDATFRFLRGTIMSIHPIIIALQAHNEEYLKIGYV